MRKTFTVSLPVRRAVLFASALGVFVARVNGRRAGQNILAPEWTDYHAKVQYQGCDVTEMIVQGENAIGAVLAPGWYAGQLGLGKIFTGVARGYTAGTSASPRVFSSSLNGATTSLSSPMPPGSGRIGDRSGAPTYSGARHGTPAAR